MCTLAWQSRGSFRKLPWCKNAGDHLLPPDRGNNVGGGYPAGVSGTSRVFHWRIAGNDSGHFRDFFMLLRFCCLSVFHAANVGVVNFHCLWCVFGPFYFLFIHHDLLDEEPQQFRCQRLNIRVSLRFVEERCRIAYRIFQPLGLCFSPRKGFCQLLSFLLLVKPLRAL